MLGKRRTFRVKSSTSVTWTAVDTMISGQADVINLSLTGLAMIIYEDLDLPVGTIMFVEPNEKLTTTVQNKKGRIAWFKKESQGGIVRYHCGIEFIK